MSDNLYGRTEGGKRGRSSLSRLISLPSKLGFGDRLPSLSSLPSFSQATNPSVAQGDEQFKVPYGNGPVHVPGNQPGDNMVTSSNLVNPSSPPNQQQEMPTWPEECAATQPQQFQQNTQVQEDFTISSWLENLGLSAYVDNFHQQGYRNMFEIQHFTLEDLQKMKIGTQHRNNIWRALVEFRNAQTFDASQNQQLQRTGSDASTVSLSSDQNAAYCPGFYEVTRYTFKHTISLKKDDHDYC